MPSYFMTVNKKRFPLTEAEYLKAKKTRYSNTTFEVIEDDPDLRNVTAEELIKGHEEPTEPEPTPEPKMDKKSKPKK